MIDTKGMSAKEVLEVAGQYAKENGIGDIVVASTVGETGMMASEMFGSDFNLVVITHSTGFRESNVQEMINENKRSIELNGGRVFTGTMLFHNLNDHLKKKGYYTLHNIIADTLRIFGQGTKVCVEIVAMATDAGLIDSGKDVVAVAGTGRGADTVLLVRSENSRRFFDIYVRDVIAKPR